MRQSPGTYCYTTMCFCFIRQQTLWHVCMLRTVQRREEKHKCRRQWEYLLDRSNWIRNRATPTVSAVRCVLGPPIRQARCFYPHTWRPWLAFRGLRQGPSGPSQALSLNRCFPQEPAPHFHSALNVTWDPGFLYSKGLHLLRDCKDPLPKSDFLRMDYTSGDAVVGREEWTLRKAALDLNSDPLSVLVPQALSMSAAGLSGGWCAVPRRKVEYKTVDTII